MSDVEFGRCKDCEHWDQGFRIVDHRTCLIAIPMCDESIDKSSAGDSVFTASIGGEGDEGSELWTGPEFGCIQFKKRETT